MKTVLRALREANTANFRVVHYSVQENHLHLIVEAESKRALSSGMRGIVIRIARRVNRLSFRRCRFWADRWHGNTLTSPRQVRNALVYVLKNRQKHATAPVRATPSHRSETAARSTCCLDPLSSAQWFDGFANALPNSFRSVGPPSIAAPASWLLRLGWRRHGRIKPNDRPKLASLEPAKTSTSK